MSDNDSNALSTAMSATDVRQELQIEHNVTQIPNGTNGQNLLLAYSSVRNENLNLKRKHEADQMKIEKKEKRFDIALDLTQKQQDCFSNMQQRAQREIDYWKDKFEKEEKKNQATNIKVGDTVTDFFRTSGGRYPNNATTGCVVTKIETKIWIQDQHGNSLGQRQISNVRKA